LEGGRQVLEDVGQRRGGEDDDLTRDRRDGGGLGGSGWLAAGPSWAQRLAVVGLAGAVVGAAPRAVAGLATPAAVGAVVGAAAGAAVGVGALGLQAARTKSVMMAESTRCAADMQAPLEGLAARQNSTQCIKDKRVFASNLWPPPVYRCTLHVCTSSGASSAAPRATGQRAHGGWIGWAGPDRVA